jgi:2-iminobutanoate/2-iminopropanoate deaminase
MIQRISPPGAPAPRGPYSPAVRAGDTVYVAGQISIDPISGEVIRGDVAVETRQVLKNIQSILEGCGASMAQVVRCGVYLTDAADFQAMNAVYAEFFGEAKPARTTIIVAALPLAGAKVEIDAVAYLGE